MMSRVDFCFCIVHIDFVDSSFHADPIDFSGGRLFAHLSHEIPDGSLELAYQLGFCARLRVGTKALGRASSEWVVVVAACDP